MSIMKPNEEPKINLFLMAIQKVGMWQFWVQQVVVHIAMATHAIIDPEMKHIRGVNFGLFFYHMRGL